MAQVSRWHNHIVRVGPYTWSKDAPPDNPDIHRKHVEPWLAALLQAEHLNLLIGSGLTLAIANEVNASAPNMRERHLTGQMANAVAKAAKESAKRCGRGEPNIEDQIRAALELIGGLRILAEIEEDDVQDFHLAEGAAKLLKEWEELLDKIMRDFLIQVLTTERQIKEEIENGSDQGIRAARFLGSFLLTFASRVATRERLHIFTTNYDRLIEYGCDLLGLRIVDRFVGQLSPVFRSSRLEVDLHYNPPGLRGEPRYLEGVIRLTKLHGSIDWRQERRTSGRTEIRRCAIPFGADETALSLYPQDNVMIYPNPAKDVETLEYPYAELFRDFAASVCQPNTVVFTYGYGFGDDHINRILRDMLTIPSTHLAIISYDGASDRIHRFCESVGRYEQITLLIGSHFGDIKTLVEHYLPKPAIDKTTWRMVEIINRRTPQQGEHGGYDEDHSSSEVTA